jgi:RNA recognition motif. (a.k.a. RRM, RBD, or RNP domain)
MFDPSDFNDETFSGELETDVASECGKCGQIEKITVFSKHPNGVVIVKFNTSYASQECVKLMDGRFFGGKKLRCYFWDGATDFTGKSSVCLPVCLSLQVSLFYLSVKLCFCLSICPVSVYLFCLSVPVSVCLSVLVPVLFPKRILAHVLDARAVLVLLS